ncbi:MAG TPA: nicotinate-nicotinamide nucleotide adenylyltransferase [Lachnospiraceae bacterium]|nr:nicotinate-nicotinamide nucleotide adenylyltransferase [Lachnospiraceae bacterium]
MNTSRRRVGIMGGTFDPIHIGHLILGESAWQQFSLEKVLFMPSGNPPHKKGREGATNEQRVEMVRLAIASNPHFVLSLEEMHEKGYVYTKETLRRLRAQHPDTDYYFILGADSLLTFDKWNGPQEICDQCILAAAVRDSMDPESFDQAILHLKDRFHADIRKLASPNLDISSHNIRSWIQEGRSIRYYVPDPVLEYILDKGIYG